MSKFIIKFLLIFVFFISLMFFTLIYIQKYNMDKQKERGNFHYSRHLYQQEHLSSMHRHKNPPVTIPIIVIIAVSSLFVYVILKYIDKNFVEPLGIIENNVDKIKNGILDIEFKTKSENEKIIQTFKNMNGMVEGLKQREKLHDNFIRNLVHDLRAPVIAQERAMKILSDEMKDNSLIQGMAENNEAYLKMINSIIETFSQQDIKIEKIEFDFSKLTDTIITALKPAAEAKHIHIIKSVQNNFILWADFISVNRIVMNLVANAIDNIDNNKTITIKALKNKKVTAIIIDDNGKGMTEEERKKLFTKHEQRKFSNLKSVSGIGLSIVHDLVLQNGGRIIVESEKNRYTKFIIELENKNEKN